MKTVKQILAAAGLLQTYWGKKIIAAQKRGHFTESNKKQASDWPECACGKTYSRNKYQQSDLSESPVDEKLGNLGGKFAFDVEEDHFIQAAKTMVAVEKRAIIAARIYKCQEGVVTCLR